jgi:hypothetical protein
MPRARPETTTLPARRGDSGADHGDARPGQQGGIAQGPQQRRRRIDGGQHRRIGVVAQNDQAGARPRPGGHFGLDLFDRRRGRGAARLADHAGQGAQRGLGRAEPLKQLAEGDGTDAFGAGQPQPGEPLGLGQGHAALAPMRGSVPRNRRPIF